MRLLHKIRWSIEQRGLIGTLHSAAGSLRRRLSRQETRPPHPFDLQHSVNTDGLIPGHDLAVGHANDRFIAGYAAIPPSRFRGAIERWQASGLRHPVENYTFIDFGCGKGRATLLASEFPFRQVIGVELNPTLAEIARTNAAVWTRAGKARSAIQIVCADALEMDWPPGPCLTYLYNPFGEQVMHRLAEKMKKHFSARPGDLEIVYQKPEQAVVLEKNFEMVWCEAIPMSEEDIRAELVADSRDESRAYRLASRADAERMKQ